jgi:hypothetical protein
MQYIDTGSFIIISLESWIFKFEVAVGRNCLKPVCAVSNFNKVTTATTAFAVINPGYDAFAVKFVFLDRTANATN